MRIPRKGQKGFTLIELLIVVAILGVLAAVIIPNVQQFIGAGETEAQETELSNIQLAVTAMMVDNQLTTLPVPVTIATNDMSAFPDETSSDTVPAPPDAGKVTDLDGDAYDFVTAPIDQIGYILYGHDIDASPGADPDDGVRVNYVAQPQTAYWYTVTANGTVSQYPTAPSP